MGSEEFWVVLVWGAGSAVDAWQRLALELVTRRSCQNKWGASELRAEPEHTEQCCEHLPEGSGKSKQSSPEFPSRAFLTAGKLCEGLQIKQIGNL